MSSAKWLTGFQDWMAFGRATLALGITVAGIVWAALTYALDKRYAPMSLSLLVAGNEAALVKISDDLEEVTNAVNDAREGALYDRIFELKVKLCSAEERRRVYSERLVELRTEYLELTEHDAILPECSEL